MDQPISKEESYAERRRLFKNIWEAAMRTGDKDPDIMSKPKVIKTLRLAEIDRCAAAKKQRIKNLRTVCNKILDFCERQDADDRFYEQVAAGGPEPLPIRVDEKPKKSNNVKNKVKKLQSMITPMDTEHRNSDILTNKISRNNSPIKIKRTTIMRRSREKRIKKINNNKHLMETSPTLDTDTTAATRKVIRTKTNKRRRSFNPFSNPGSSVKYNKLLSRMLGHHTPLYESKQPHVLHKLNI